MAKTVLQVDLLSTSADRNSQLETLFAEELGLILEVASEREQEVVEAYRTAGLSIESIGEVTTSGRIEINVGGESCISGMHHSHIKLHCTSEVALALVSQLTMMLEICFVWHILQMDNIVLMINKIFALFMEC